MDKDLIKKIVNKVKAAKESPSTNKEVGEELKHLIKEMQGNLAELDYHAAVLISNSDGTDSKTMQSVTYAYDSMKRPLVDLEKAIKEFRKVRGIN